MHSALHSTKHLHTIIASIFTSHSREEDGGSLLSAPIPSTSVINKENLGSDS